MDCRTHLRRREGAESVRIKLLDGIEREPN